MAEPAKPEEVDSRTRAQAKKELHARKVKEREQQAADLKAAYVGAKDDVAIQDILEKARQFKAWHNKLAIDGVGARNIGADESGAPIVEDFYLDSHQVARELGGVAALEQLLVYIETKLK